MDFDFDAVIDRSGTSSTKYDKYKGEDILPLWVADMDFRSPEPVIAAIKARADHGVFGYTETPEELTEVILARLLRLYDWSLSADDLVYLPGVVPGLNLAVRALTTTDEAVMTTVPIYPPFMDAPAFAGREVRKVQSIYQNGEWQFPLADLAKAAEDDVGLMLLCNPYNPVGKMLTRSELTEVVRICRANDVVICSDEIHCDLILDGRSHIPTASLSREAADVTVTLLAPSKTFNLAGFGGSFAVIQNPVLREKFVAAKRGMMPNVNLMAYETMLSAYRDCDGWYRAMIQYLEGNRDYLFDAINALPGMSMNRVEATYLAWLDVSALKLNDAPHFFEQAGVGMSEGYRFGDDRFMRLNFGCPRSVLEEAVRRLARSVGASA